MHIKNKMQLPKEEYQKEKCTGCGVQIENLVTRDNGSASLNKPHTAEQFLLWWNFQSAPYNHFIKDNYLQNFHLGR